MIELRRDVDGIRPELVEVYRVAFGADPEDVARFRDDQLIKHPAREDFRIALAKDGERIVGFGYGYTGHAGQWWTDRMREHVPPKIYAEWFGGHYEVVELAVHPDFQRRGLGQSLLTSLLEGLPNERALLSTYRSDDYPARRLYLREGWRPLADVEDDDATVMGCLLDR